MTALCYTNKILKISYNLIYCMLPSRIKAVFSYHLATPLITAVGVVLLGCANIITFSVLLQFIPAVTLTSSQLTLSIPIISITAISLSTWVLWFRYHHTVKQQTENIAILLKFLCYLWLFSLSVDLVAYGFLYLHPLLTNTSPFHLLNNLGCILLTIYSGTIITSLLLSEIAVIEIMGIESVS